MGKSKDLASGNSAAYVETAGDSMTGELLVRRARSNTAGDAALTIHPSDTTVSYGMRIDQNTNSLNFDQVNSGVTRMSIDSAGRVTTPNQPAFMVIMTSAPILTGTSTTILPWNSEIFDTGSNFNTSNYRFTAPVSGKYHMHLHLELHSDSNWNSSTWAYIGDYYVNGSQKTGADFWGHSYKYNLASNAVILDINANDYVDVRARPNNNTLRYSGDSAGSFGNSRWFGYLIG